jgi:hypothetical protein
MMSGLSSADFDDLHDFVKVQVAAGFAPLDAIVDEAVEVFAGTAPDPDALRTAARAVTEQALSAHMQAQLEWPETTDCDRLDAAFAELDRVGIVARQHYSCCGTCGSNDIRDEMDRTVTARGFTFFHIQDTEHAVGGEFLYLSYGSVTLDRSDAVAIGREVVDTLSRYGLSPAWDGRHVNRIGLSLTWQRRRPAPVPV